VRSERHKVYALRPIDRLHARRGAGRGPAGAPLQLAAGMPSRFKRALVYLFILSGQVAGVLNGIAAVLRARDGHWGQALLYLLIALALFIVTIVAWYSMSRQQPYHWRDGDDS
jgi:hypothetical protein